MKVEKIITEVEDLDIVEATLLAWEAESLPMRLRQYGNWWWLRVPNAFRNYALNSYASNVDSDGSVDYSGLGVQFSDVAVRPALKVKNLSFSNLKIGDVFTFGGKRFEIISDEIAFCLDDIGTCAFRKDWQVVDANDYEKSDVKKFVDDWFNRVRKNND